MNMRRYETRNYKLSKTKLLDFLITIFCYKLKLLEKSSKTNDRQPKSQGVLFII